MVVRKKRDILIIMQKYYTVYADILQRFPENARYNVC